MYYPLWKNYYFEEKKRVKTNKWNLMRQVGKDILTPCAQLKLEWIIFYYTLGAKNASATSAHFGVSRKTFGKWLKRFSETSLKSLEDHSKAPKRVRGWMVTAKEEGQVKALRKEHLELGKVKLKVLYRQKYGEKITTWKIERVVRKHHLYPNLAEYHHLIQRRKQAQSKPKLRIHQVKEGLARVRQFGFFWHIDAVVLWWYGQRRIIFTALEETTKMAYARVYSTHTSTNAADFLKRLVYLTDGKVTIMHSDNGAEFAGNFEKACGNLGIVQVYSRPHTPKDNSALERFNRTIQEEWLDLSKVGLESVAEANEDLTLWLLKYNSLRPHQALDYLTPLEYAQKNYFQVSPMWSANTVA